MTTPTGTIGAIDGTYYFEAQARGDLDGDAATSLFQMRGEINATYADGPAGTADIYKENELE